VTGGASVYGQYYIISQGTLTLGALIMAAHPDQTIPPGFQSAALKNANPQLAGLDPNVSIAKGTRVNIPSRWVDALKKAGYSVGNNMGVGCPKADAMLKQVDPYGIAMGVGYAPPGPVRGSPWKAALAIAAVAVAVGGVTVVATRGAKKNPRRRVRTNAQTPFERGWMKAIKLWKDGVTWESITHKADQEVADVGRGMVASVDAMSGWLDKARREAKSHGIPANTIDDLIARAIAA
jgi:hypothetical protein